MFYRIAILYGNYIGKDPKTNDRIDKRFFPSDVYWKLFPSVDIVDSLENKQKKKTLSNSAIFIC